MPAWKIVFLLSPMAELDMSEAALQKVVAANPVAAPVDGEPNLVAAPVDGEPAKHTKQTKTCKCGNCAECTERVAVKKRKAKERKARHRAGKRAAGDERKNERKRERRAANQKAGDHGEQAENTKARQEKRAGNKKVGDNEEKERRRERRTGHQKQWKDHPTGADALTPQTQTHPNRLHTHTHPSKRLAHPFSPIPSLSTLTSRATHAHPTSPRSTGFCAIWGCISSSSQMS